MSRISKRGTSVVEEIQQVIDRLHGGGIVVMIEDVEGNLFEIERVYFSVVSGGQVRIKALAYDDEFDPEDSAPDPDVEL